MRGQLEQNLVTIRITPKQYEKIVQAQGKLMIETKKPVSIHEALESLL